jgi:hypothetical protein
MEYTLEQLKVMAYDELVKLETSQANLRSINQAISEKQKVISPKVEPKTKSNP